MARSPKSQSASREYVAPGRLHSVYAFDFIEDASLAPSVFKAAYERESRLPAIYARACTFSNHDFLRPVTRYAPGQPLERRDDALAKLCLALLLCLRGTALLYQGEELGLPEADIPLKEIKDPVGRLYYPLMKGRDGCRTPMPWQTGTRNAAFTHGSPWLRMPGIHQDLAVDAQEWDETIGARLRARDDPSAEELIRHSMQGDMRVHSGGRGRSGVRAPPENERIFCVFNVSRTPRQMPWHIRVGKSAVADARRRAGREATYSRWIPCRPLLACFESPAPI